MALYLNGREVIDQPFITSPITLLTAATRIIPGATSVAFRNNADTADNLLLVDAGDATLRRNLIFAAAAALIIPGATSVTFRNNLNNANRLMIMDGGAVYLNDNANTFMTQGLTIQQGGADDEILTLKSTDVAHGMTVATETDTYGLFGKIVGASGGLMIDGFSSDTQALLFQGIGTNGDTTKVAASVGYMQIRAAMRAGASTGPIGTDANMFVIRDDSATRVIFDKHADMFMLGVRALTANVADGRSATHVLTPTYSGAWTVTRHNYIEMLTPTFAGGAAVTDAAVMRFDAAAGAHAAVAGASVKGTPGGVDAWVKVNINGTIHYMPAYLSMVA